MRSEKRPCSYCKKELIITRSEQLKKKTNYCNTICYNHATKRKYIDGYKKCKNPDCNKLFPYRNSLQVRSVRCYHTGILIGSVNQLFCNKKCSLLWRNKYYNPIFTEHAREKIRQSALKRGVSHMHTPEALEKRRKAIMGENHWNWQGGKTSLIRKIRNCFEYINWRKSVFVRDNYTCTWCGIKSGNGKAIKLNADHIEQFSKLITKFKISSFEQAINSKELWDINNGRTLCLDCHKKTETFANKKCS